MRWGDFPQSGAVDERPNAVAAAPSALASGPFNPSPDMAGMPYGLLRRLQLQQSPPINSAQQQALRRIGVPSQLPTTPLASPSIPQAAQGTHGAYVPGSNAVIGNIQPSPMAAYHSPLGFPGPLSPFWSSSPGWSQ